VPWTPAPEAGRTRNPGYDPGLWSVVFPLGMYVAATHDYATEAHQYFLYAISNAVFWAALLAWVLTFIGMWVQLLRSRSALLRSRPDRRSRHW
jgi:tellurite resistance protein TehA-like permease